MEYLVREASSSDSGDIIDFQVKMAWETEMHELDRATVAKGVRAVFEDESKGKYFVLEKDGRVVASLMITFEWSDWRNALVWWIQSVYVIEEERAMGVFRKLYEHIRELVMQDESISGLRLYVDLTNTRAQQVYRRIGMNGDHYTMYEWMKDK